MSPMRVIRVRLGPSVCLLALPALAHAQSSLIGVVKDTSGAVLPGVSVEATSDALIERARSTVTTATVSTGSSTCDPACMTSRFP